MDAGSSNSTAPAASGDIFIDTPEFRQLPDCLLPVEYVAEGLPTGVVFDKENNKLVVS